VLTTDAPWLTKAACHGMDQSLFFPDDDLPSVEVQKLNRAAKLICADCPVREACLADALSRQEVDGVWGGATPKERQQIRGAKTRQWTEEERAAEVAKMVRRYENGDTVNDLAAAYGIHNGVVSAQLRDAGVKLRATSRTHGIDDAELARRYIAGASLKALGREYGLYYTTVRRRLHKMQVPLRAGVE